MAEDNGVIILNDDVGLRSVWGRIRFLLEFHALDVFGDFTKSDSTDWSHDFAAKLSIKIESSIQINILQGCGRVAKVRNRELRRSLSIDKFPRQKQLARLSYWSARVAELSTYSRSLSRGMHKWRSSSQERKIYLLGRQHHLQKAPNQDDGIFCWRNIFARTRFLYRYLF